MFQNHSHHLHWNVITIPHPPITVLDPRMNLFSKHANKLFTRTSLSARKLGKSNASLSRHLIYADPSVFGERSWVPYVPLLVSWQSPCRCRLSSATSITFITVKRTKRRCKAKTLITSLVVHICLGHWVSSIISSFARLLVVSLCTNWYWWDIWNST